jgi:RecG-like helicase
VPEGSSDSLFPEKDNFNLSPVYQESRGVSSNWIYHFIQKIFKSGILESITDLLPKEILDKYNLPCLKTALIWIHAPQKEDDQAHRLIFMLPPS